MPGGFETPEEVLASGGPEKPKTTADELDYYFINKVAMAASWHQRKKEKDPADYERIQGEFVAGLEETIGMNLPVKDGVTNDGLRDMRDLAKAGPWTDKETLRPLYRRYCELRHKEVDVGKALGE